MELDCEESSYHQKVEKYMSCYDKYLAMAIELSI